MTSSLPRGSWTRVDIFARAREQMLRATAERRAKNQAFNQALKALCAEHRVTGESKREVGRVRARWLRLLVTGGHVFPPELAGMPDDCQFPADQVVALYTLIYG